MSQTHNHWHVVYTGHTGKTENGYSTTYRQKEITFCSISWADSVSAQNCKALQFMPNRQPSRGKQQANHRLFNYTLYQIWWGLDEICKREEMEGDLNSCGHILFIYQFRWATMYFFFLSQTPENFSSCSLTGMFSHSPAEGEKFLCAHLKFQFNTSTYHQDFVTSPANRGPVCDLHKCDVEAWSLWHTYTENGPCSEVGHILCTDVCIEVWNNRYLQIQRFWEGEGVILIWFLTK